VGESNLLNLATSWKNTESNARWRESTLVSIFLPPGPTLFCFKSIRNTKVNWVFIEAEMAKNRIEELKAQDFQRKREELIYNQTKEREEVE